MFKQYDYFYTPEQYKNIWENALFVFDTNTLLNLYRYQEETKNEFLQVLDKISNRIWIPHHVALEFQRNRLIVICEQKELFSRTKKALDSVSKTLNTELEKLKLNKRHSLIKVDNFSRAVNELFAKFEDELDALKANQQHLSKADSLKERLESLFESKVGNAPHDQKEVDDLYKEAENRYKNNIPPGYLDNDKNDICIDSNLIYKKKYGDFLVWRQLLNYTKENDIKQVVFITNDLKIDWWTKFDASGEKFNQPRPELIDEALHVGGIDDFLMYDSEKFLSSSLNYLNVEVSDNAVQEVRDTIEMYNKDIEKSNFYNIKEERNLNFEKLKQKIALEKVKEFQSKINYLILRNGGISEFPTDVLSCPECGLDTMIFEESSSTGYKCTYCKNEESDEIEVQCSMCGSMWPNSEIVSVDWTDEGHVEDLCPRCRRDPDYVGDD
ncbi:PIN-like domain-containing protein [Acinetobacter pittii]|uniref:PIN-like domain-containing protein n=1 Tax=Acinetobacter pittii TaxID=48296 RepID=UPI00300C237F